MNRSRVPKWLAVVIGVPIAGVILLLGLIGVLWLYIVFNGYGSFDNPILDGLATLTVLGVVALAIVRARRA